MFTGGLLRKLMLVELLETQLIIPSTSRLYAMLESLLYHIGCADCNALIDTVSANTSTRATLREDVELQRWSA